MEISQLKKVTLILRIGSSGGSEETGDPASTTFIYGIGRNGLTPLEYRLAGKKAGDEIGLRIDGGDFFPTFEHLLPMEFRSIQPADPLYLDIRVEKVESATDREVVSAIAEMGKCGGGDDCCGPGCGHHGH